MSDPRGRAKRKGPRQLDPIGWREWVALPDFGIDRVKVKVDTGARSSALHAFDQRRRLVDGATWIRFRVHPRQRSAETGILVEAPLVGERWVKSSTGHRSLRPVVRTRITLGTRTWPIEITLVRRDVMGFRMLLGRRAIRHRFLVDAGRSYLHGPPIPAPMPPEVRR